MVGYWAEMQVFGRVVLFDRGASELEALDAYIHPPAPFLIFKLSDAQLESFSNAIPADESSLPFPFATEKYAQRINPDESMSLHIFRNRYERKPPVRRRPGCGRRIRLEDEPYIMDFLDKLRDREKEERKEVEDGRPRELR
ncbi:hypothetical protein PHISCL_08637 [Aspergillus sclerotialis]|uniref:Uncharacterized protein n=1 Tax=Aspergillus sclerotialis TaxID=2070753 RepID=A0A3A2ZI56_9EURO|nr:hypothetical protein PHISCL_08637 [Aspergillus sclerotialis]